MSKVKKQWQGAERRSGDLSKEEKVFRAKQRRRAKDRQNNLFYFLLIGILSLTFFLWLLIALYFQMKAD